MKVQRPTLDQIERVRGYLHESHKVLLANDPDFLNVYDQLYRYILMERKEPELHVKTKELVVIGILASKGEYAALELHVKRALDLGDTPLEILEALEAAMFYSGAPSLIYGIESLERVLLKLNRIDPVTKAMKKRKSSNAKNELRRAK
jgi:alkylhydroperoxidase/carboxymuconolactone decarboxylase family protein YurZ